jgi:hypothetical protein
MVGDRNTGAKHTCTPFRGAAWHRTDGYSHCVGHSLVRNEPWHREVRYGYAEIVILACLHGSESSGRCNHEPVALFSRCFCPFMALGIVAIENFLVVGRLGCQGATNYENINQNMAMAAIPMAAVANQPTTRSRIEMMNFPMIFGLTAMNIISPMIGTETTPLMTALQ